MAGRQRQTSPTSRRWPWAAGVLVWESSFLSLLPAALLMGIRLWRILPGADLENSLKIHSASHAGTYV